MSRRPNKRSEIARRVELLEQRRLLTALWASTDSSDSFATNIARLDEFIPKASEAASIGFDTPTENLEAGGGFIASHGVLISPAAGREVQGVYSEGQSFIESLDGYDGSYKADGDNLLLVWPNVSEAFTIFFTQPVASVGSFIATGKQGDVETLSIGVFDALGREIDNSTANVSLFDNADNREGYWGVKADGVTISKVSIRNDNPVDFGNVLMMDDLRWSRRPAGILPGDADFNGTVEFSDFLTLATNFGRSASVVFADGDFDENGQVGFGDFLLLAENFGRSSETEKKSTPTTAYVKFDGVDGESADKVHSGWSEAIVFEQGQRIPVSETGSTRRRGAAEFDELVLVSALDKSGPKIAEAVARGQVFPSVELDFTNSRGDVFYEYELTNVLVSDYVVGVGFDEVGRPLQRYGLDFEEIKVTYTDYDATGVSQGKIEYQWKIEEGEALSAEVSIPANVSTFSIADAISSAPDMFIKFDGVNGESIRSGHEGWSEALLFEQGQRHPESDSGATRRRGDVIFDDLVVISALDKAGPKIAEAVAMGKVYPKVELELLNSQSDTFYAYELKNVLVTDYVVGMGFDDEGRPLQRYSLNFEEINVVYSEYDTASGSKTGDIEYNWKVEEGEALVAGVSLPGNVSTFSIADALTNSSPDMFIRFDGVDGESTASSRVGWSNALAFEQGQRVPTGATGSTRRRGDVMFDDFVVITALDKAGPKIAEAVARGQVFPSVEIDFTNSRGDVFYEYELTNVLVSDYVVGVGFDEAGRPLQRYGLDFEEIKVTYTEYDATGASLGKIEYQWKIEEGEALSAEVSIPANVSTFSIADAISSAPDMFIKFDGVNGESIRSGHEGWSEALLFEQGQRHPESDSGATRRRGDVIFDDLVVISALDKAGPKIAEAVAMGKVYPKVELELLNSQSDTFYAYELKNVLVTDYVVGMGFDDEGRPLQRYSLNFEEINVVYSEYDTASGSKTGDIEYNWKVEEGEALVAGVSLPGNVSTFSIADALTNSSPDMFIRFDGVDGESTATSRVGWSNALAFEQGQRVPTGATGTTRRRGDVMFDDFVVITALDKAGPKIAEAVARGQVFPSVEIDFTNSRGDVFYEYELTNVLVSDYVVGVGFDEAGRPLQRYGLDFEEIKVTYTEYDATGASLGKIEYQWKIEEGEALTVTASHPANLATFEIAGETANSTILGNISTFSIPNAATTASTEMFVKFDGVDGESTDAKHLGWSEALVFEQRQHRPQSGTTGATRRRGAVIFNDFVVISALDKSSLKIADAVARGKVFPKVEIELSNSLDTFYAYELTNVIVTNYVVGFSFDSEGHPLQRYDLNFEEIKVSYTEFNTAGAVAGAVEYTWKVEEGEGLAAVSGQRSGNARLTQERLDVAVAAAIDLWTNVGIAESALSDLQVLVSDLGGNLLGYAVDGAVWIDDDAAGLGWFVDESPLDDEEFASGIASRDSPAAGRVDLLTAIAHELGHVLGLGHTIHDGVMEPSLSLGERRIPMAEDTGQSRWPSD